MQDGIVKRLLDDTCPPVGRHALELCPYRNRLPTQCQCLAMGREQRFHAQGGFASKAHRKRQRIIIDSLRRYPLMHLQGGGLRFGAAIFHFKTGDGIESQVNILEPGFEQ